MTPDSIDFLFKIGIGPWLTPLRGKVPMLDAWQSLPPVDIARVRSWLASGANLGLRTGAKSGLIVIDNDQARKGVSGYTPPPTGLWVITPTGGTHSHYRYDPSKCVIRNSVSVLAIHVDVRGEGGQVVVPPSIHPETGTPYRWGGTGEPGTLDDATLAILNGDSGAAAIQLDMTLGAPAPAEARGYAATALVREAAAVRVASEGTRNHTLNTAAFNLGQLVASGELDQAQVEAELSNAASIAGLGESEARSTIASGLKGGAKSPRKAPEPKKKTRRATSTASEPAPKASAPRASNDVLVPGPHVLPGGEYQEQGSHTFAAQVLAHLDPAAIYRRAEVIGEIHAGAFRVVSVDRMRSIVDASVRLISGKPPRKGSDDEPSIVYHSCPGDTASVVLEFAAVRGRVRELKHIVDYPVCVGAEFELATPGWNPESGVYLASTVRPQPLPVDVGRAVLEDLICDFPFASDADRANYIGLLLTVIMRPAIAEPVPMHLIGSPIERSGKTKLAEIVLGCGLLGRPTPAMQIGVREEEREKRLTAALLAGDSVLHLDNLHDFVDSASLASLLTSSVYRGRELGKTRMLALVNGVTIVGTGNNVHATGEITKRIVPIMLQPPTESPEDRVDYRHPLLRSYVESQRERTIGALLGFIAAWRDAGRPTGNVGLGGFERWAAVVGGIMAHAGYPEWCKNLTAWRGATDDFSSELREFVKLWAEMHFDFWVETGTLFDLAIRNDLFERKLSSTSEHGRKTAFGQRVLCAAVNRVVDGWRIELEGRGKARRARLVRA